MNTRVPQNCFAPLFFASHPHCPSRHPLEHISLRRFHRSLKRWNQSLKNKPIAAKENLQVNTDPSLPLTPPCEFLCLIAILLTAGEMCFQMFPTEIPDACPGGIWAVRCIFFWSTRSAVALGGVKSPSPPVREPSAVWENAPPPTCPSPSVSLTGSHSDPVVCLILIGCQLPDPVRVCKNGQLHLLWATHHNCQGLERKQNRGAGRV